MASNDPPPPPGGSQWHIDKVQAAHDAYVGSTVHIHPAPAPPPPPFMAPAPPAGFVQRPAEFTQLKQYLLDRKESGTMAISAALRGAGGYGKTTLAQALCADPDVRAAFPDGILWVELGQQPGHLAGRVQDWIYLLTGARPGFEGLEAATANLRTLLAERQCLLVLDDVWDAAHTKPFLVGGPSCVHLLTTRNRTTLPPGSQAVDLDAMQGSEAVQLLGAGLPPGEETALRALAARLGEWPLLLTLVSGALRERVQDAGKSLSEALGFVTRLLDKRGLTAFDADNPVERGQAVEATLRVSLDLLKPDQRARFAELAVFPEDTDIPLTTVGALWGATGGYDADDRDDLCGRLHRLSLLLRYEGGVIRLHDMVRAYLLRQVTDLPALHGRLVDAWGDPHALPDTYAWAHLAYHLREAERLAELRSLLLEYAWLRAKLEAVGPVALLADYDMPPKPDEVLLVVQRMLRLGVNVLTSDLAQLPAQLWGRLDRRAAPEIAGLQEQAALTTGGPWLRPLYPCLTPTDGPLLRTLEGHSGTVQAVAVTVDGRRALSGGEDGTVRLWDLDSGAPLRILEGHSGAVRAVALTAGGEQALSGGDDGTVRLWDLRTGALLHLLTDHTGGALVVTVGGGRAVSGGADGRLRVWDLGSGTLLRTLEGHSGAVRAVAVTVDGRRALSGGADGTVRLWDLSAGTVLDMLVRQSEAVQAVAVTVDGRRVVFGRADGQVRVWDLSRGSYTGLVGHRGGVWAVAVAADGRCALTGGSDGQVRVWDLRTRALLRVLVGHIGGLQQIEVLIDKDRPIPPPRMLAGHTAWVTAVAVTVDGRRALSGGTDGTVRLWDLDSGTPLRTLEGHRGAVRSVAVTADGEQALSGSLDGTVGIWNLSTGTLLHRLAGDSRAVLAVTADAGRALTGGSDGQVRVWDLSTGALLRTLEGHSGTVLAMTSGNGHTISTGDRGIDVWDLGTGTLLGTLEGHSGAVRAVAVTPDSGRAVSGGSDGTVRIWDLASQTLLHVLADQAGEVLAVAVAEDGRRAVSGGADGRLRVWDLGSGALLRTLEGHTGPVYGVAVMEDGQHAFSSSYDGTVRVWNLMSGAQFAVFIGDAPFLCCSVTADGHTVVAGDGLGRVHFLRLENA